MKHRRRKVLSVVSSLLGIVCGVALGVLLSSCGTSEPASGEAPPATEQVAATPTAAPIETPAPVAKAVAAEVAPTREPSGTDSSLSLSAKPAPVREAPQPAPVEEVPVAEAAPPPDPGADQVTGLRAWHREGQTFLTWKEVDPPVTQDAIAIKELKKLRGELDKQKKVRYRIYRSDKPIKSVQGLTPMTEVPPLTCWNTDFYGIYPKDQHMALRYAVEDGKDPVPPGTGIHVHNPLSAALGAGQVGEKEGKAYYAVTYSAAGAENTALGKGNTLAKPLEETVGQGIPVLQRIEERENFQYTKNVALHFYVRWEVPPNCAPPGKPFDYLVAVPPNAPKPTYVGLHLHCWGGNMQGGYGWWSDARFGSIMVSSSQIPYDWWTGYHEMYWTAGDRRRRASEWPKGVVRPYSTTRMLSFLDWVATKWEVDLNRTFVAGSSMGGAGSLMFAIRYAERLAYCRSWVGVHIPAMSPQFKGSYEGVYGKPEWGIKFEDGTPVWDYYDDTWYLRKYPEKEIGFLTFSNGKNDGAIGWPQAVRFYEALQETKRPHLFVWGMGGHGQRARLPKNGGGRDMPITVRIDQTLPAFTNCSLDDDPGTATGKSKEQMEEEKKQIEEWNKANPKQKKHADRYDGVAEGQVNLYLYWETDDIVDEADRWEMTVALVSNAPKDECTVNITPRRVQAFKPEPGTRVKWTNTSGGEQIQSGEATVDEVGLITLEKVIVGKGKNRLTIRK